MAPRLHRVTSGQIIHSKLFSISSKHKITVHLRHVENQYRKSTVYLRPMQTQYAKCTQPLSMRTLTNCESPSLEPMNTTRLSR